MVKFLFIEAFYNKEVSLNEEALNLLRSYKTVALFASVQFVKLEKVKEQLKDLGINTITSKARRTSAVNQTLGCDCSADSFEDPDIFNKSDVVLYVGDGLFHPKALLLAQQNAQNKKDVIMFDPISDSVKVLTQKDIENQKKKYHSNMVKYMHAKNVGVLVSTKTGQQYLNSAVALKGYAERVDKNFFIFVGDTFNMGEMENFPFIEAWVNTACPRIGTDDIVNLDKPLININDALRHAQQNIAEVNVKVEDSAKPIYAKNVN